MFGLARLSTLCYNNIYIANILNFKMTEEKFGVERFHQENIDKWKETHAGGYVVLFPIFDERERVDYILCKNSEELEKALLSISEAGRYRIKLIPGSIPVNIQESKLFRTAHSVSLKRLEEKCGIKI